MSRSKRQHHYIIVREDGKIERFICEGVISLETFSSIVGSAEFVDGRTLNPPLRAMLWFDGQGQLKRLKPNLIISGFVLGHMMGPVLYPIVGPVLITRVDEHSSGFDASTSDAIIERLAPFATPESMADVKSRLRRVGSGLI